MLQKYKSKREEGFTIIEVLIVLAIAGLIILIVFLAVPALQRNSRNTQRSEDASKIAAAIQECFTSNHNSVDICLVNQEVLNFIDFNANQQLTGLDYSAPQLDKVYGMIALKCNEDGTQTEPSDRPRALVITWLNETSNGTTPRCLEVS